MIGFFYCSGTGVGDSDRNEVLYIQRIHIKADIQACQKTEYLVILPRVGSENFISANRDSGMNVFKSWLSKRVVPGSVLWPG